MNLYCPKAAVDYGDPVDRVLVSFLSNLFNQNSTIFFYKGIIVFLNIFSTNSKSSLLNFREKMRDKKPKELQD